MIERACWLELGHAAQDRAHPWRVMTLATVDRDRADARSVVIRDVEEAARRLIFYTDARSAKIAQMHAHPRATLVGWWPKPGWQLRLSVTLSVQTSGLDVSSRWARVKLSPSAQDYLAALPPGTPVERFQPERGSREHFAVVTAQIDEMDWLELHENGHRRARLAGDASTWLTP
ncbi:pyridoxamine 5'-phosphate oxidase [Rubrivivax albus]|uniref:Pyridoxamine 5'-phosphate oxidase n=2 Tax=Rubrivivax albus TaxID=2499835 RepID=A0A437JYU0_9BURK|nr:pyridoxamine 5'-phosphate oxidase [Rubrivivax albus]